MVGEIRDLETAQIAVQAALTGHLRAVHAAHQQRRRRRRPAARHGGRALPAGLGAARRRGPAPRRRALPRLPGAAPATAEERCFFDRAGLEPPASGELYRPVGCEECEGTGFVGRVAILEFLETDEAVRDLIRDRAPTQAIQAAAVKAGMRTMFADGLQKCLAGTTTLEEVCRVTEDW